MTLPLALFALILLGLHLLSCAVVLRRLVRRPKVHPGVAPSITLLRPVCGLDPFDAETLGSSFVQDYPDFEVIFCAARSDDPVVPVIRDLIARHPQVRAQLLIGEDRVSSNPKLNNMEKGWRVARGEWVAMADANLLLPPDYLWHLVTARRDGVKLVTSPPIGIRAEGAAGALEAAFLNGNQARLQLFADALGHGFAQGKTLFWDRAFLNEQGGLAALGRFLAEDVAATKLVRGAGYDVVLTPHPFAQPIGRRSLSAVWARQLRWSKVRRDGFPGLFLLEPLNGGAAALCAAGLAWGPVGMLAVAGVWYGAELVLCWRAGWPIPRWTLPMMLARDLLLPVIWGATFGRRGFEWRGNTLAVAGTLEPAK